MWGVCKWGRKLIPKDLDPTERGKMKNSTYSISCQSICTRFKEVPDHRFSSSEHSPVQSCDSILETLKIVNLSLWTTSACFPRKQMHNSILWTSGATLQRPHCCTSNLVLIISNKIKEQHGQHFRILDDPPKSRSNPHDKIEAVMNMMEVWTTITSKYHWPLTSHEIFLLFC